jgi:bifunctional DNA-binding transcriptional regulator/antitoxin component of YhaV-PrlF toxin-antitoxin module
MKTTVLTLQTKGQIMLPKEWRDEFGTTIYQAIKEGDIIILHPLKLGNEKTVMKAAKKVIDKNLDLLKSLADQ